MTAPAIRVLYVDDEPFLLEITKAFLELEGGIEVAVMESGVEALIDLRTQVYDVIVSDYQMPALDGLGLLKALKEGGSTVPFVLFTGKGREDVAIEAINHGADFYLQKGGDPNVQFKELRNVIVKLAQKRAAEKALQESERKYRELVEGSNSIILRVDMEGRVRFINEFGQAFFGYSWDEIVGRSVIGTIVPMVDDRRKDMARALDDLILDHINNTSTIGQNIRRHGEQVWIAWNNRVITDEEGQVKEILSIGTDMTALHLTEERLKSSVSLLKATLDATTDGIVVVDLQKKVVAYNNQFLEMWRLSPSPEESERSLLNEVLPQLKDPGLFRRRTQELPDERGTSFDVLELVDGRAFEMVTRPQRSEDVTIGRVWSFHDITDRRTAENALKASESRLRAIFENSAFGIALADTDGRFIEVNSTMEAMTGYSRKELTAKSFQDITRLEDLGKGAALFDELLEGSRDGFQVEERLVTRSGKDILVRLTVSAVRDEQGRMRYNIGLIEDLSEKAMAEGALKVKQEELALITANTQDLITRVDREGRIVYASPSVFQLLGYSPEEIIGETHSDLIHPEHRKKLARVIEESKTTMGKSRLVSQYIRQDGRCIWMETSCSVLADENGKEGGAVLSSRDVSERHEFEESLYVTERKFRDIFDHANDAILIFDPRGFVQEANKVACQRLGYTYLELIGMNVTSIDGRYHGREGAYDLERSLKEGHGVIETEHIAKDGTRRPVEVNCALIAYGSGSARLCIARDISERKETERRLLASEHLLQQTQSTAHIGGYHIDMVQGTSEWTDEAFRICGIDPIKERSRREDYLRLVLPQDRDMVNQAWWEMPEKDTDIDFVYRLLTPDGRLRHIHNRGRLELDDRGEVVGIFGTIMDVTDLKEAELKLTESRALLAEAQKLSRTGSYRYDLRTWEVKWSEEMFRLFGMDPAGEEPTIEAYWKMVHHDDLPGLKRGLRRAVDTLSPFDLTYRVRARDAYMNVQSIGKVEAGEDGAPTYIIGTMTDITDRLRAEKERQRMERRFRDIFDSANDILVIVDDDGQLVEANSVACRRLGYSREELLRTSLSDIIEPSSRAGLTETFARIMDEGELLFESNHLGKGGTVIPVEISGKAVDIEGHRAALLVARDVTERKDAERRLMESRRLLAEAEKASKMGSFRVNWATGNVQISEELYNILDAEHDQGNMMEFMIRSVHPEDRNRFLEAVELVKIDRSEIDLDYRFITSGGAIRYMQTKTRPEFGSNGKMVGIFGTVMDVTERKRAEQAAGLAELKIALLGDITRHDVHNKVTALSGYLQLAEMRSVDPAAKELLAKARIAAQSITRQMAFAQEYQALGQNEAHWIDLADAFRKGVADLDLGRVRVRCALDGYEVFADPMLEKVFHNLVENSVRYGRTATLVEVDASITGSGLHIICQDDGVGISDEDRPMLFDWEFRGRRGHGLHFINEVLRISDMSIKETGESGHGTRFEILVPTGRFRSSSEGCLPLATETAPG